MKVPTGGRPLLIISAALLLFSCAPIRFETGNIFTEEQIKSIERGMTTRSDIERIFGPPQMRGKDDDNLDIWTYIYVKAEIPLGGGVAKEEFRRMTITFDNDTVKSVSYELSEDQGIPAR